MWWPSSVWFLLISYGGFMSEWQSMETAPQDGSVIILDVGYPWAVVGVWNLAGECWCTAKLQVNLYEGEYSDTYFQSEIEKEPRAWHPMPETESVKNSVLGVKAMPGQAKVY